MQFDKKHWNPANIPGTPQNSKMTGATLVLELEPRSPFNRPESETLWKTVNTPLVKGKVRIRNSLSGPEKMKGSQITNQKSLIYCCLAFYQRTARVRFFPKPKLKKSKFNKMCVKMSTTSGIFRCTY